MWVFTNRNRVMCAVHRINIYIEEKATKIVFKLEIFMSFDRNSYAFLLYTVCTVFTAVHKSLPYPQKRTEPIFIVKTWMFVTKIKLLISLGLCWNQCRNIENVLLSTLKLPS